MNISSSKIVSPQLKALVANLEIEKPSALEQFWQDVARSGTPLIEPLPDDREHRLVTFLWRGDEKTHNVVIVSALTGTLAGWRYHQNQLTHLPQTDLWYRSYRVRSDVRATYRLSPNDALLEADEIEDWTARTSTFQSDPLNPHHFLLSADEESGDEEEQQSILELPDAPSQRWTLQTNVASGKFEMHRFHSQTLNNERRIWVYTPPGYDPEQNVYPLMLLFDGFAYHHEIPTPTILDNLQAEGRIEPMIAILVDSLSYEDRERELFCYQPFVTFLTEELLPWAHQHYALTSKPEYTIVGGSSAGGLAAAFAAWKRPDVFGNVLSQSGSVFWTPLEDFDFEWLIRQFVETDHLPLRFYLEVGTLENNPRISFCPQGPTQLAATRHLRNVLRAKGYSIHYQEYNGGHEYLCWRETLADGIIALANKNTE